MKKFFVLSIFACDFFVILSCTGDMQKQSAEVETAEEPQFQMTAKDTSDVLMMTGEFLGYLKTERYDSAVAMLHAFDGDTLTALSSERATTQKAIFKRFHGIRYQLTSLQFNSDFNNRVDYVITLFDNAPDEHHANTVRAALNPVRIDGQWYLTAVDSKSEPRGR